MPDVSALCILAFCALFHAVRDKNRSSQLNRQNTGGRELILRK